MKSKNMIWQKKSKYKNYSCTVDNIRFDSRKEAQYYGQLKMEKEANLIKDFERQVSLELYAWVPYDETYSLYSRKKVCRHIVDFLVTLNDGSKEIREVKGFATDIWDLKRKLTEANYPQIPYKVVR